MRKIMMNIKLVLHLLGMYGTGENDERLKRIRRAYLNRLEIIKAKNDQKALKRRKPHAKKQP